MFCRGLRRKTCIVPFLMVFTYYLMYQNLIMDQEPNQKHVKDDKLHLRDSVHVIPPPIDNPDAIEDVVDVNDKVEDRNNYNGNIQEGETVVQSGKLKNENLHENIGDITIDKDLIRDIIKDHKEDELKFRHSLEKAEIDVLQNVIEQPNGHEDRQVVKENVQTFHIGDEAEVLQADEDQRNDHDVNNLDENQLLAPVEEEDNFDDVTYPDFVEFSDDPGKSSLKVVSKKSNLCLFERNNLLKASPMTEMFFISP